MLGRRILGMALGLSGTLAVVLGATIHFQAEKSHQRTQVLVDAIERSYSGAITDKQAGTFDQAIVQKVRMLLDDGARVNGSVPSHLNLTPDGRNVYLTPLHAASCRRLPRTVALLIRAGADVNARDSEGETPLMYAANDWTIECMAVLLHAGADPKAKNARGKTVMDQLRFQRQRLLEAGDRKKVALLKAAHAFE